MAKFLEKTLSGIISTVLGSSPLTSSENSTVLQKLVVRSTTDELVQFTVKLQKAQKISHQHAVNTVHRDTRVWKEKLSRATTTIEQQVEILHKALMVISQGHKLDNLQIGAAKLTQARQIHAQKMGTLFLTRASIQQSDVLLLVVNTVYQMLTRTSLLSKTFGLSLLPLITSVGGSTKSFGALSRGLSSSESFLRRKTAICVLSLTHTEPDEQFVVLFLPKLLQLLVDPNFSVCIVAIQALGAIFRIAPHLHQSITLKNALAVSCAHILKEAMLGHLPNHYNLASAKAPFVQVQVMQVLSTLKYDNWEVPEDVLVVLGEVLTQKTQGRDLVICMALLEATYTICAIASQSQLVVDALNVTMGFLRSPLQDIRGIGLRALSKLFGCLDGLVTLELLKAVIDCLYSCSQLVQCRALQVLFTMANHSNYKMICRMLLKHGGAVESQTMQQDTHLVVTDIILTHCDDMLWFSEVIRTEISSLTLDPRLFTRLVDGVQATECEEERHSICDNCRQAFNALMETEDKTPDHLTAASLLLTVQLSQINPIEPGNFIGLFFQYLLSYDDYSVANKKIVDCLYKCSLFVEHKDDARQFLLLFRSECELTDHFMYEVALTDTCTAIDMQSSEKLQCNRRSFIGCLDSITDQADEYVPQQLPLSTDDEPVSCETINLTLSNDQRSLCSFSYGTADETSFHTSLSSTETAYEETVEEMASRSLQKQLFTEELFNSFHCSK